MKKLSENCDFWGFPTEEKEEKHPKIQPIKKASVVLKEAKRHYEAEQSLLLLENKTEAWMMEVTKKNDVSIELEYDSSKPGQIVYFGKVLGNFSFFIDRLRSDGLSDEDIQSKIDDLFSKEFVQILDRELWDVVRRLGKFENLEIEITRAPSRIEDFEDAEVSFVLILNTRQDDIDQSKIENEILDVINHRLKYF